MAGADSAAVVQALGQLDAQRMARYRDNLAFYDGAQWQGQARRRERRLVFNYTRTLIEKAAAFTLTGMKSVIEGQEDAADDPPALVALRAVYEANDVAVLDFDSEVDCSVLGDGAFRVAWDVDTREVRVTSPDVQGLFVWSVGGDYSRPWRVAQRYTLSDEELAVFLPAAPRQAVTPAVTQVPDVTSGRAAAAQAKGHEVVELWTADLFELFVDGKVLERKPNPYGWIPYVVYPNVRVPKRQWGQSDIEAVRESQRELNRAMSQLSAIMELSGNPIAVLENITQAADIDVTPGAVWTIPEDAKAYLLDLLQGGGVALHKDFVELVYRTLHDVGESPRVSFGEAESAVSGVAMELQMDPLVKKVERKRRIRAAAFRRRDELVLQLLSQFGSTKYEKVRTRIVWGQLLPQDRQRLVGEQVQLVAAGISSRRTSGRLLGSDDADAEFTQWQVEQRAINALTPAPEAAPAAAAEH